MSCAFWVAEADLQPNGDGSLPSLASHSWEQATKGGLVDEAPCHADSAVSTVAGIVVWNSLESRGVPGAVRGIHPCPSPTCRNAR